MSVRTGSLSLMLCQRGWRGSGRSNRKLRPPDSAIRARRNDWQVNQLATRVSAPKRRPKEYEPPLAAFIRDHAIELRQLAVKARLRVLAYLLEMVALEADRSSPPRHRGVRR